MSENTEYRYAHINSNTTTTLKNVGGFLHGIAINNPGTGETITIFDSATGSGSKLATVTPSAVKTILYDIAFGNGLTITTAGTAAGDYTVLYQ